jgi:threonine-phosphate decarboxylase
VKFAKSIENHILVPHGGLYSIKNPDYQILDFSSNVNPLGYPNSVAKLFKSWMKKIPVYPDHNQTKLKHKLAKHLGISENNLVVGNGATEIIYNFCRVMIGKNTKVLIPIPTFGEYEAASRLEGAKIEFFRTMNLAESAIIPKLPKNGIVFICNPNNPTGVLIPKQFMIRFIRSAKEKNTMVFVDECFMELTQKSQSVIHEISKFDNLFVLRSLTKSFGLAGLRAGYGIGNKNLTSILNKIKIPWNVSGLAQEAATAAISDRGFLPKTRLLIKKESNFLRKSISKLEGFSCFDTSTNFILIKTDKNAKHLQKKLLKKNILIRDCSTFRGLDQNYIRIAVKTRKENLKLIRALGEL